MCCRNPKPASLKTHFGLVDYVIKMIVNLIVIHANHVLAGSPTPANPSSILAAPAISSRLGIWWTCPKSSFGKWTQALLRRKVPNLQAVSAQRGPCKPGCVAQMLQSSDTWALCTVRHVAASIWIALAHPPLEALEQHKLVEGIRTKHHTKESKGHPLGLQFGYVTLSLSTC